MKVAVLFLTLLAVALAGADAPRELRQAQPASAPALQRSGLSQPSAAALQRSGLIPQSIQTRLARPPTSALQRTIPPQNGQPAFVQYYCCHCGTAFIFCGERYYSNGAIYAHLPNFYHDGCGIASRARWAS